MKAVVSSIDNKELERLRAELVLIAKWERLFQHRSDPDGHKARMLRRTEILKEIELNTCQG